MQEYTQSIHLSDSIADCDWITTITRLTRVLSRYYPNLSNFVTLFVQLLSGNRQKIYRATLKAFAEYSMLYHIRMLALHLGYQLKVLFVRKWCKISEKDAILRTQALRLLRYLHRSRRLGEARCWAVKPTFSGVRRKVKTPFDSLYSVGTRNHPDPLGFKS